MSFIEKSRFEPPYQNKMLEIKSTDELQSSRLNTIEALDKTQNERLNAIEAVNKTQTERLDAQDEALETEITKLKTAEDERARKEQEAQYEVDRLQNSRLDTAESVNAQQTTDISNQADKDTELEGKIDSNKSAIDKNAETIGKNASAAETALNAAKSELQQSIRDANATIEALQGTVTDLSTALQTTKDDLATTQTKAEQLEGLLRIYAAATAKDTQFTLFRLTSSKNKVLTSNSQQDETFNLLNGFSATLNFNIEDDPNWRASAYSELLFNGKVVSNERSYTGTVNSNLTVKHRNTLTGKESATKTIRFVEAAEPDKNPTGLSWLTQADSNNIINWRSHLSELTAAAVAQNSRYGWPDMQQDFQYSRDDGKTWETVTYELATMFGNSDKIYLQVDCKQYDRLGNSKECIINLGSFTKGKFQYDYTEYSIDSTATVKANNISQESFTLYGLKSSDISVDDLLSKNSTGVTSTGGGLGSTNFSISASQIVVGDTTYTYQANLSTPTQRVYSYTSSVRMGNTSIEIVHDITLTINSNLSTVYYVID